MSNHNMTTRIFDILELLARHAKTGLRFSDVSKELSMPKSSLHPVINTMCARKYVIYKEDSKRYYLGEMLFTLGNVFIKDSDLIYEIDFILSQLPDKIGATCYFGVLSGNEALYLLRKNAVGNIQITATPGYYIQAHSTGLGKSLLSGFTREKLDELYPNGLEKITPNTITDLDVLYDQLVSVRKTGFSYETEESSKYIQCIATPVKYGEKIIAAISAAFPVFMASKLLTSNIESNLLDARRQVEEIIAKMPEKWFYSQLK